MAGTATAERVLTIGEAAEWLGCSIRSVERVVARGELRTWRLGIGGWRRFRLEDLEALRGRFETGSAGIAANT